MTNWREELNVEFPMVTETDIASAGLSSECFWCNRKIGRPHAPECVRIVKIVRLRYIFNVDVLMPHSWDKEAILFHRNEGSWCANNALDELEKEGEKNYCLCDDFACKFIKDIDGRPRIRGGDE